MTIQSLSIVVPNKACINKCKFCVSRQHCETSINLLNKEENWADWVKRLAFARDNGCNTVILTGESEPQQNREFLQQFANYNATLTNPFRIIELQTTGVLLDDEYLDFLKKDVGVTTISISLSSFYSHSNAKIVGMPEKVAVNLDELCKKIKERNFNLRLSVNLTDEFDTYFMRPQMFFNNAVKRFDPDQITLRILYADGDSPQAQWVRAHSCHKSVVEQLKKFIQEKGKPLGQLPYGLMKYSVCGMSTVIDGDCMSKEQEGENYKYLILRPDCHLYSRWDDKASRIFQKGD